MKGSSSLRPHAYLLRNAVLQGRFQRRRSRWAGARSPRHERERRGKLPLSTRNKDVGGGYRWCALREGRSASFSVHPAVLAH